VKIVTVVGARPQFIKAAVVSRALSESSHCVTEVLIHTGQHYDADMSDVFFDELEIPPPHHYLGIGGGTHGQNTGRMIEAIERAVVAENPDWLVVYGDTDSTLAAAIAGAKLNTKIAHVEAGLRSFNRQMPEEVNRILTDHVSDVLFTPTDTASRNLAREGIDPQRINQVGDVMYDATLFFRDKAERESSVLERLSLERKRYILATIHRQENTDNPARLGALLQGLAAAPFPVIWPLHPRTRKRLPKFGLPVPPIIRCIEPTGYLDMAMLERHAYLIATDSGGVQKEAFFNGIPCITLRDETEWVELTALGANRLTGVDSGAIADALNQGTSPFPLASGIFGDGDAGRRIAALLAGV
jgi:UDP-GlcNAc3NAcA epimerase